MTYEQLLDRIISDGIAEVREAYADPKDHHRRDGAVDGFEACRGKTPTELVALWHEAEQQTLQITRERRSDDGTKTSEDYWRQRYKALQIEFVCNVVSVGITNSGGAPLLAHQPTMRGAMKYAQIVGVRGDTAVTS